MTIASLSVHRVKVRRYTTAIGTSGTPVRTFTTPAGMSSVAGRIQPMSAKEIEAAGKTTQEISHKFYTEASGILARDRIIDVDGNAYDVTGVRNIDHLGRLFTIDMLFVENITNPR